MNATDDIEQFRPSSCLSVTLRNLETVKDSYNSGPSKNRMSGGHFHQSCHVTKACVSLNWHQRRQTCWVLRREGRRNAAAVGSPWMCSVQLCNFCEVSIEFQDCADGIWLQWSVSSLLSRRVLTSKDRYRSHQATIHWLSGPDRPVHYRTVRFGPRSFRMSAPTIWNELLSHLKDTDTSRGQHSLKPVWN